MPARYNQERLSTSLLAVRIHEYQVGFTPETQSILNASPSVEKTKKRKRKIDESLVEFSVANLWADVAVGCTKCRKHCSGVKKYCRKERS